MKKLIVSLIMLICTSQTFCATNNEVAKIENETDYIVKVEAEYRFEECGAATEETFPTYQTTLQPRQTQNIPYKMGELYDCKTVLHRVKFIVVFDENDDQQPDKDIALYAGQFKTYTIESAYGSDKFRIATSQW